MRFNHTNTMKDNDKPEAPEGYAVMLGKDFTTDDVLIGTKAWSGARWSGGFLERQEASQMLPDMWYAVPTKTDNPSQSIAEEAAAVVAGDRAADYGDVNESFTRIAKLWSAYTGSTISPWDVAQMMILLKVSRAKTSTKRDTLVDIIGYAECADQLRKVADDKTPKKASLHGSYDIVRGHKALDAVKHCQDRMTEEMRTNDLAMRNTPPREWTLDQVGRAVETAEHVNKIP